MKQKTIDNGNEFVIDTKTALTEDSVYFKDNGDYISIAIENEGGEEATYLIYKDAALSFSKWLTNHVK